VPCLALCTVSAPGCLTKSNSCAVGISAWPVHAMASRPLATVKLCSYPAAGCRSHLTIRRGVIAAEVKAKACRIATSSRRYLVAGHGSTLSDSILPIASVDLRSSIAEAGVFGRVALSEDSLFRFGLKLNVMLPRPPHSR